MGKPWMSADDNATAGAIRALLRNMPADARREVLRGLDDEAAVIVADLMHGERDRSGAAVITVDPESLADRARSLATAYGERALRAWFRSQGNDTVANSDSGFLYGSALGAAQAIIRELLDGQPTRSPE